MKQVLTSLPWKTRQKESSTSKQGKKRILTNGVRLRHVATAAIKAAGINAEANPKPQGGRALCWQGLPAHLRLGSLAIITGPGIAAVAWAGRMINGLAGIHHPIPLVVKMAACTASHGGDHVDQAISVEVTRIIQQLQATATYAPFG